MSAYKCGNCGTTIRPGGSKWTACKCGAMIHFKRNKNGRLKKVVTNSR